MGGPATGGEVAGGPPTTGTDGASTPPRVEYAYAHALCHAQLARRVATPATFPTRPFPCPYAGPAPSRQYEHRRVIGWFRRKGFLDEHAAADMLARENSGFSIDAGVRVAILDRYVHNAANWIGPGRTRQSTQPATSGAVELVQVHDDRDIFQASPDDLPVIDIHSL